MASAEINLADSGLAAVVDTKPAPHDNNSVGCRLCGSIQLETIYDGPIRSGGAASGYEDGFSVRQCASCGIAFLDPFPVQLKEYYETERYWVNHHGNTGVAKIQRKLQPEQLRWLSEIGLGCLRGKRVADFGCGAGIFLDLARGIASETLGVDPAEHFRDHLEQSGHQFFQHGDQIDAESVDVAVSFDTIEHLEMPVEFLKSIYRCLRSNGHLYLGVPNQKDFLKQIVPAYLPFFYHKSHLFYFSVDTLVRLFEEAGFRDCRVQFVHKYDLMNLVVWARDSKGQGVKGSDMFDRAMEDSFRANLERQGISSHILVSATK